MRENKTLQVHVHVGVRACPHIHEQEVRGKDGEVVGEGGRQRRGDGGGRREERGE